MAVAWAFGGETRQGKVPYLLGPSQWLALPMFPEWWEEFETSLKNEDWLKQFILDSRRSERLAVVDRERIPQVLEEFRRRKRAMESGRGSPK